MQDTDYGCYQDNFKKNIDVKSILITGCPEDIKNPQFSIVIPTYKKPEYLREAIMSALEQEGYQLEYEVLVVDNEETDGNEESGTAAVVRAVQDKRLLYYRNSRNLGMCGNWNRCIELARSRWVVFLHDDDLLLEDCLYRLDHYIKKYNTDERPVGYIKSEALTFGGRKAKENTGGLVYKIKKKLRKLNNNKLVKINKKDVIIRGEAGFLGAPTCGTLINKEAIMEIGGYNEAFYPSFDTYPPYFMLDRYEVYKSMDYLGAYRWESNHSFQEETLYGWVKEYESFRKYLSVSEPHLSRKADWFIEEQYSDFVDWVVGIGKRAGKDISCKDFNTVREYNPGKYKKIIYKKYKLVRWHLKLLRSMVLK